MPVLALTGAIVAGYIFGAFIALSMNTAAVRTVPDESLEFNLQRTVRAIRDAQ